MAENIDDLEKFVVRQGDIYPHWSRDGTAFWYNQEFEPSKFEFIVVSCTAGTRKRAFDHAALAAELAKQTGQVIDPDNLPFWWLNVDPDASWVRFQFQGTTWQYASDKLEHWDGEFDNGNFLTDLDDHPSPKDQSANSSLTFVNHTRGPLTLSRINYDGEAIAYKVLQAGQRHKQNAWVGHAWRIVADESKHKAACVVQKQSAVAAVCEFPTGLFVQVTTHEGDEYEGRSVVEDTHDIKEENSGVFVRDFNVWARDINEEETQISTDGVEKNSYAEETLHLSPNKQMVVAWQQKEGADEKLHLIEWKPKDQLRPKLSSRYFPRVGDALPIDRPRLFDLRARKEIPTEDALFHNHYRLNTVGWSNDSKEYLFLFDERGRKTVRLLGINTDGKVRTIVEEKSETFVDSACKLYYKVLDNTNEFLWASERDGWNHLYLFSLDDGSLKNQVTKGEWVTREVERVDEDRRQVWIRVLGVVDGQDPYYNHLARVDLDGSGFKLLTAGSGTHTWDWSPDKKYFIDTWSRLDNPPESVLRDAESGKEIVKLVTSQLPLLTAAGWTAPEPFAASGRDGKTQVYGFLVHPSPLDRSNKFPVIEEIYAGPQDFYTPKAFTVLSKQRMRANQGYVMAMVDCMGTNWRSKAFHNVCYKNIKDAGFPDRMAWMRAATVAHPWMDLDRVGCYGSSAGGQNAAGAVIFHGNFYKAACAYAGCHDNRIDQPWWTELWMGCPIDESYVESSNVVHAGKLTGKLMLAHGMMDIIVDPGVTIQLAEALIEADKDFDLVLIPNGPHRISSIPWIMKKQDEFFRRHLKDG